MAIKQVADVVDRAAWRACKWVFGMAGLAVAGEAAAVDTCGHVSLLFNLFLPAHHAFVSGGFRPWAADVARVTDGRVTVVFTTATLSPADKQWSAVTSGIADVAMVENPQEPGRLKLPALAGLPLLGDTAEGRSVALWRTHVRYFAGANEYQGVKLLGLFTNSSAGIISRRHVARSDDLKGMKVWTMAGAPARYVRRLGAVPVPAGGPEMFSMFSKGIVDGLATNLGALKVFNMYRYASSVTQVDGGLYAVDFSMIMNQHKWDGICARDQAAIESVSGEVIARNIGRAVDLFDTAAQREAEHAGIRIARADADFMQVLNRTMSPVHEAWVQGAAARGVDGRAALDYFRSQLAGQ